MNIQQHYDNGEFSKVVDLLKDEQHPLLNLKAYSYQKLGKFEEAMSVWNILVQREPENGYYFNERGVCKFNLRFKHAIEDFDKAIELEPVNAYFYSCRAYVKDKTGDTEGAVDDYGRAHDLDPEDAIVLNNLGLAEQKLGHTQSARNFFAKSNDLLGVKTSDAEMPEAPKPPEITFKDKWSEVRKMMSSFSEFKKFIREAFSGKS
ncbi:tetratricopeptide repeat protein [bacterium]|nr:tetratricopeptide repeat protein [bacterium]